MLRNNFSSSRFLSALLFSLTLALSAGAQVPVRPVPPVGANRAPRPPRREPCWEVAGVSPSAIRERRSIALQARSEVESVCANSSLSIQQKRQEIKQIHERERQQIDAIISPAQREAMRSCQQSRGNVGHGGGGHLGGGGGPCGEMSTGSTGQKPHPMHEQDEEDDVPPSDTAKPN